MRSAHYCQLEGCGVFHAYETARPFGPYCSHRCQTAAATIADLRSCNQRQSKIIAEMRKALGWPLPPIIKDGGE